MGKRSFTRSLGACVAVLALAACGGSSQHGAQRTTGTHAAATSAHRSTATTSSTTPSSGPSTATSGPTASAKVTQNELVRHYGDVAKYGTDASGAERTAILSAFNAYFHAVVAGDWSAACARLSTAVQRALHQLLRLSHRPPMGCAAALKALAARTPQAARRAQAPTYVLGVRVNEPRAYVLYRAGTNRYVFLAMVNQAGGWRANELTGSSP